ncbi:MAG TPA: 7-carboxy-7-deazaguanine synthase QueE [Candidatus Binatia bacterium]|nr:7-carboxy-7-deazaguanine synthase QueE [Candidatus Binatia bacterium]
MTGYASELFVSFQGEGAHVGERHLFVRMAICNLRCRYCDTPDSLVRVSNLSIRHARHSPDLVPNPLLASTLAAHATALIDREGPVDAVAVTGGEPLVQAEFVAEFLRQAGFQVPVLLETNGMLPDRLRLVLPQITIVSMDIKPPSNTGERVFWDEHAAFLAAAEGKDLYVKVLVDDATTEDDVARAAELVACHGRAPLYLQPIMDPDARPEIDRPHLDQLFAVARRHHDRIRVLPQTHKILRIP